LAQRLTTLAVLTDWQHGWMAQAQASAGGYGGEERQLSDEMSHGLGMISGKHGLSILFIP